MLGHGSPPGAAPEKSGGLAPGGAGVARELIDVIRELVTGIHPVPADDAALLDMDSLAVVTLIEALEDRLAIRVSAREAVPENLGSVEAIATFVARKRS